jgi:Gene product 88
VNVFTVGNHKLGRSLIWGFGLPSGTPDTCPGLSAACRSDCYAVAVERYRPAAAARYRANLRLSRRRAFVRRVRACLIAHAIRVVRVHTGGDFHSPRYARRWLEVMRRSPRTRFYFYTRSWRVPAIRTVIDQMAELPNCRAWYSCDRDTGIPVVVPPRVRVAWLMTEPNDLPPSGTDLVFRVRRLRRHPAPFPEPHVCPAEDGRPRPAPVTCARCGLCWRTPVGPRTSLPLIDPGALGRGP